MSKMKRAQITLEYTCERTLERQLTILKRELLAGKEIIDNTFYADSQSFVLLAEQKFTDKRKFDVEMRPNGKVIHKVKSEI